MKSLAPEVQKDFDFRVPTGLTDTQYVFLNDLYKKSYKLYKEISSLSDEAFKGSIKEMMYTKKWWDSEILEKGGISYYKPNYSEELLTSGGDVYKPRYRVAKTSKECDKLLKFRIKTADGEIFSVTSKTQAEAQFVVDDIFGKGHYRVSRMLY